MLAVLPLMLMAEVPPVMPADMAHFAANVVAATRDADMPRDEQDLRKPCKSALTGGFLTFVRDKSGKVLLAALSGLPLADPRKDIWLSPHFTAGQAKGRKTATQDWGYVHDTNSDGRIDHVTFMIGPLLMEPETPDPDLPKMSGDTLQAENAEQLKALLRHTPLGFWHMSDLDGDGTADMLAMPAMDKSTGWHRGWALLRGASPASGTPCLLVGREGSATGPCTLSIDDRKARSETMEAHLWATQPNYVMNAITAGAAACKLTAADLRP